MRGGGWAVRLLIAESGATKTDWALLEEKRTGYYKTAGLHPAYLEKEKVLGEMASKLEGIDPEKILFYGAGCYSEETIRPVRTLLSRFFGDVEIRFHDDLSAVAHAFLGERTGVAAILGTGSNSALFEKGERVRQIAALGYVLGDEGSAADIGKRLLKGVFRERFTPGTMRWLEARLGVLEYRRMIGELYSSRRPSYYLAQIAGKVIGTEMPDEVESVVSESLASFLEAHLNRYEGYPDLPVVISGGIATSQQARLETMLRKEGVSDLTIGGGVIRSLVDRERRQSGKPANGDS